MKTPAILLLIFNRPDTTERVVQAIRAARPARLYIAADGPREEQSGEGERCARVRQIASRVDWHCEVKTLFREENLGCRAAVRDAVTWFFEQEEEGIILEDDTLPDPTFFRYCAELLARFRHEDRVMAICGGSYFETRYQPTKSYCFSNVFDPWGWASWRRAWQQYDDEFTGYEESAFEMLTTIGPTSVNQVGFWIWQFRQTIAGNLNSWAYRWTYSIFKRKGLVIVPRTNLISNIGYGEDATHTKPKSDGSLPTIASLRTLPLTFPLKHPVSHRVNMKREASFLINRHRVQRLSKKDHINNELRRLVIRCLGYANWLILKKLSGRQTK